MNDATSSVDGVRAMTQPPLFGSADRHQKPSIPDILTSRRGSSCLGRRDPFGKRDRIPVAQVSLSAARLRGFFAELMVAFFDPAFPKRPIPFHLVEDQEALAIVGGGFRISADPESGGFVLTRTVGCATDTVLTADVDRLMDAVLAHVVRSETRLTPETDLAHIECSVGMTLGDMERALILATLRRCAGNRAHAARLLAIPLQVLRSKVQAYWHDLLPAGSLSGRSVHGPPGQVSPGRRTPSISDSNADHRSHRDR